jgi:hypothetical protein
MAFLFKRASLMSMENDSFDFWGLSLTSSLVVAFSFAVLLPRPHGCLGCFVVVEASVGDRGEAALVAIEGVDVASRVV